MENNRDNSERKKEEPTPPLQDRLEKTMKWADKRFAWILLVLCAASLLVRLLILHQYVTVNPLSKTPISDAAVYWTMAERIAGGEIVPKLPFMAAPPYPNFLVLILDVLTVFINP